MTALSCPLYGGLTGIISYGTIRAKKFDAGVIKVKNNGENHLVMRQYEGIFHHAIVFLLFSFSRLFAQRKRCDDVRRGMTLFLLFYLLFVSPISFGITRESRKSVDGSVMGK